MGGSERKTETETDTDTDIDTETETDRDRHRDRDREKQIEGGGGAERQTVRDRLTERKADRETGWSHRESEFERGIERKRGW